MHVSRPIPVYKDLWAWSFALAIAGYPLVAILSSLTAREDGQLSIVFRILVICLCGLSFLFSDRQKAWRFGNVWLFYFVGFYMLRLGIDANSGIGKATEGLVFATITSILPAALLALATNRWSEINVAWAVFIVGALAVTGIVWLEYSGSDAVLFDNSDRLSLERLNPISIGHVGLTTLIASYTLIRVPQRKILKFAIFSVAVAAAFTMHLAAARGPIVALACCIILFPMLRPRFMTMIMGWVFVAAAVLVLATVDMTPLLDKFHFTETGTAETNSTLARVASISYSWELFKQNPWFGYGTQLPFFGYPHNMFMEILQAMGLVGIAIFVLVFVKIAMGVKFLADRRLVLLPLLTMQAFVGAQFSGSLWGTAFLWIVVTVLIFRVNAMRSFNLQVRRRVMERSYAQFGAVSGAR
ncbi:MULTISPECIES: O-antigen ligase family protein [unclassified Mesorhizobium]|uniref:O-antigen ligase family protein n=1 Tax=unclassified Mesorhizobium TaxID=325217 RepID=UPI000FE5FF8D|nr:MULTISPECIES: O-antigen ligase family protein [unclassified Mesorhizobium]RWI41778.1 MAG: O-antigen ligase family protein [Mesorhizobium sp.]